MLLKHAFKEWAVICKALATGRQLLILRKGGIDEPGGDFGFDTRGSGCFRPMSIRIEADCKRRRGRC